MQRRFGDKPEWRAAGSRRDSHIGKVCFLAPLFYFTVAAEVLFVSSALCQNYQRLAPQTLPSQSTRAIVLPPTPTVQIGPKDLQPILSRLVGLRLVNYPSRLLQFSVGGGQSPLSKKGMGKSTPDRSRYLRTFTGIHPPAT